VPACTVTEVSFITFLSKETGLEKFMLAAEVRPETVPFHHHDCPVCRGNAKSRRGGLWVVFVMTLKPSQPTQYSLTRDQFSGTIHLVALNPMLTSLSTMQ